NHIIIMNTRLTLILIPILICISLGQSSSDESIVREAMKQAIVNLSQQTPPTSNRFIDSQRANGASIAAQRKGDLLQETTRLLIAKHGVEIIPRLSG
ncbi:hypothetical protein PRIPAC_92269, partial [Pristionchus pacificus]|uniref:Uncharacterized protein n=1 Tax=Pristionchus pacificus TaxID=54126 RepID=A0A8R1UVZ1_PRIPA